MSGPLISLPTGHTVEFLNDEDNEKIQKSFPNLGNMIRLHPGGWLFEECMQSILERIYSFQFRPTDVLAMTYPKSGTTWSQEILWTFLHNPNLDNPEANIPLDSRSTMIESDIFFNAKHAPKLASAVDILKNGIRQVDPERVGDKHPIFTYTELCLKDPRIIKTHLLPSLLPPTALKNSKILYVARDPRDVISSRYSFAKLMKITNYLGTFEEFIGYFLNEDVMFSPFWLHLKEAWDLRHHSNLLFVLYEDLRTEPLREYERINKFLGLNLSESQVKNIIEYTSFERMKIRNAANEPMTDDGNLINQDAKKNGGGFFRLGKVGDWRDKFSPEQVKKINNWIKKSTKDFPSDMPYLIKE